MATLSAADLLAAIKSRGPIPTNNVRFGDSALIALANEEMRNTIYPMMLGLHEEFFLQTVSYAIASHPSGFIPIPKRAYGRGIREVKFKDVNNNYYNLPQISLTDKDIYAPNSLEINGQVPYGFYFYNDGIQLYGNVVTNSGGVIEITYVLAPPTIIAPDAQGRLMGAAVTTLPTVDPCVFHANTTALPTTWTLANGLARFDLLRVSTGAVLLSDLKLTVASATTSNTTWTDNTSQMTYTDFNDLQLSSSAETELYLAPAGQNSYACTPVEANQLLVMAVCMRVFMSLGYTAEYQVGLGEFQRIKKDLQSIYADRITGEPKKLVDRRGLAVFTLFPNKMRRRSATKIS